MSAGWIGIDLDKTLAKYDKWRGELHIGAPLMPMVERIKKYRAKGIEVRVFTARMADDQESGGEIKKNIEYYCNKVIGEVLPVTDKKDYDMTQLFDDLATPIVPHTGMTLVEVITKMEESGREPDEIIDFIKRLWPEE